MSMSSEVQGVLVYEELKMRESDEGGAGDGDCDKGSKA
jgi:hypothetical protein